MIARFFTRPQAAAVPSRISRASIRAAFAVFCSCFVGGISAQVPNLASSSAIVGPSAGVGTLAITASQAWTVISSDAWLTVSPLSGTTNATLNYSFAANTGTVGRIATLQVSGATFTLVQAASNGVFIPWGSSANSTLRTLAGNGTRGFSGDGATSTAAQLNNPAGIAVDAAGNVYIADTSNQRIRKISAATGLITTIAGTGTCTFNGDGNATVTALCQPSGLATDSLGNLFIADAGNNRIRKLTLSTGAIRTIAGSSSSAGFGGDGGTATSALLNGPYGVAVDSVGNVYFSDTGNQRIRKIAVSTGIITTIAGTGTSGFSGDGGAAVSAQMSSLYGVVLDGSGNLFFSDSGNNRIRKVTALSGIITTVAGNGSAGFSGDGGLAVAGTLYDPRGLAMDRSGNLYIAQMGSSAIRLVASSDASITTVAGVGSAGFSGDGVPASPGQLNYPYAVAVDNTGNLYIADIGNQRVRFLDYTTPKLNLDAKSAFLTATAGTGTINFTISPAGSPWFASSDSPWLALAATGGIGTGTLNYSFTQIPGITSRSGQITVNGAKYTVTQSAPAVSLSATASIVAPASGSGAVALTVLPAVPWTASSSDPWVTVSPSSGTGNATITYNYAANSATVGRTALLTIAGRSFTVTQAAPNGAFTSWGPSAYGYIRTLAGTGVAGYSGDGASARNAQLKSPSGLAIDRTGNIYFADTGNNVIRKIAAGTGTVSTYAGTGGAGFSGDGGGALFAQFASPTAVALDGDGNLYVADLGNGRIRKVDAASGLISTVAGSSNGTLGDGGPALAAYLAYPIGIAVDGLGNLYIADTNNARIRRVDAVTGVITTVAGTGSCCDSGLKGDGGPGIAAQVNPRSLTTDLTGSLYIADAAWGIRRLDAAGVISTLAQVGFRSLTLGPDGNLYAVDGGYFSVMVTPSGGVTTLAGTGTMGYSGDGGPANAAQLNSPAGVAVDASGNVYIADTANNRIRVIDRTTPQVTLSANSAIIDPGSGSGTLNFTVSPAGAPWFASSDSAWLTLSTTSGTGSGTLTWNFAQLPTMASRVGTITINGVPFTVTQPPATVTLPAASTTVVPIAGSANLSFSLSSPGGQWFATSDSPWLTLSAASGTGSGALTYSWTQIPGLASRVAIVSLNGTQFSVLQSGATVSLSSVSAVAGPSSGTGTVSLIVSPAVPWTAVSADTWLTLTPGSGTGNSALTYTFTANAGAAARIGTITVAGVAFPVTQAALNGAFTPWGVSAFGAIRTIAGIGTAGYTGDGGAASAAQLQDPSGVAVDRNGNVFIADTANGAIRKVSAGSGTISTLGTGFSQPSSLRVDVSGDLYVTDTNGSSTIRKIVAATGNITAVVGGCCDYSGDGGAALTARVTAPRAVIVAPTGEVFIADTNNHRIRKISATGTISTIAGTGVGGFSGDGSAAVAAQLYSPRGLALDPLGNLYVSDAWNHRVRKLDVLTGTITTVAGTGSPVFSGDGGRGVAATVSQPLGLIIDSSSNLYIADSNNNRIRKLDLTTGLITTVAGSGSSGFVGDAGPATSALLSGPTDVAVDGTGNLYIADTGNNRIRVIDYSTPQLTLAATVGSSTATAGTGSVSFTISPANSPWFASSDASWLTLGASSGTGPGTLTYNFETVPGISGRTAQILINGAKYIVNQAAPAISLSATAAMVAPGSGAGSLALTMAPAVPWTATSSDSWLTVLPANGIGSASLTFAYTVNAGSVGRNARITVAGKRFTLTQPAPNGAFSPWGVGGNGYIRTVVGTGTQGYSGDGAAALSALLNAAQGVASDRNGNIFVADTGNNVIRKFTVATGTITTIAGTGGAGFSGDGGGALFAQFSGPSALALDGAGNLFISDTGNRRVRRVDAASGLVSTVAGNSPSFRTGGDGGPAVGASFQSLNGIALDPAGSLYIADSQSSRIRKVDAQSGLISTVAGTTCCDFSGDGGPGTSASLYFPYGVAVDDSGNIYIADTSNSRVRKIDANGIITTLAQIASPRAISIGSDGNIYVAGANRTQKISPTGVITSIAGTGVAGYAGDGGPGTAAQLSNPSGITVDPTGNIYVADSGNNRIRAIDLITPMVTFDVASLSLTPTAGSVTLNFTLSPATAPWFASSDSAWLTPGTATGTASGTLSLSFTQNSSLSSRTAFLSVNGATLAVTQAGALVTLSANSAIRAPGAGSASFNVSVVPSTPWTAVSSAAWLSVAPASGTGDGTLTYTYTANTGAASRVATITVAGKAFTVIQVASNGSFTPWGRSTFGSIRTIAGTGASGFSGDGGPGTSAQVSSPASLAVDATGNVFIADQSNHRVRKVDSSTGVITTVAGTGTSGFGGDGGPGTLALLSRPSGVAVDASGNLVIADSGNKRVRVLNGSGNISTVVGTGAPGFSGDGGLGTSAQLSFPVRVATDSSGNIYIADSSAYRVRKLNAVTGIITSVAGTGVQGDGGDAGPASAAQLNSPQAVAVDSNGNLYIAEQSGHRVRRVDAGSGLISTVIGTGNGGFNGDGAAGTATQLSYPAGLAVDGPGNLYVADQSNSRVRKLSIATGLVSTIAGGGNAGTADGLQATTATVGPVGVAMDASGNVYIAESTRVRVIDYTTPQLTVSASTIAIGSLGGTGSLTLTLAPAGAPWFASSDSDWLTLGVPGGEGSGTLSYTFTQNTATSSRTAIITLNGTPITVTQVSSAVLSVGPINPEPSAVGQTYAIYYTITSSAGTSSTRPTGTVTVSDGTISNTCVAIVAMSNCALASLTPGPKTITVTYSGDASFGGSSATKAHEVYAPSEVAALYTSGITHETRPAVPSDWSSAVALGTAEGYKAAWTTALLTDPAPPSGFASTHPSIWKDLSNIGGTHANVASHFHVDFRLTQRSYVEMQLTPDFGWGGSAFVDDTAVLAKAAFTTQAFNLNFGTWLDPGPHVLDVYGADYCCDTGSSGSFGLNGANAVPFTVNAGTQTIAFGSLPAAFVGGGSVTLVATSSSGFPVSFTSNSTAVCTVSGAIATLLATGTCSITASQAGNSNFSAAMPVTQTFTVSAPTNATVLTLADAIGGAGQTIEIPLNISSNGTAVPVAFQLDLNFDSTKLSFVSARIGTQTAVASKSLSAVIQPNGDIRLLASGINQLPIANGVAAFASFTLRSQLTTGTTVITPRTCLSTDSTGRALITPCSGSTIRYATCDLNADGTPTVSDVQLVINEALGVAPAIHDLNFDGSVNVADVQKVINAALGLGCILP